MDCNPPGSSVHGISQARILDWVAISFSIPPSYHLAIPPRLNIYHILDLNLHINIPIFNPCLAQSISILWISRAQFLGNGVSSLLATFLNSLLLSHIVQFLSFLCTFSNVSVTIMEKEYFTKGHMLKATSVLKGGSMYLSTRFVSIITWDQLATIFFTNCCCKN